MSQFSSQQHGNATGIGYEQYGVSYYIRREVTAHIRRLYHLPFSTNTNARICPLRKITHIPLCLKLRSTVYHIYSVYSVATTNTLYNSETNMNATCPYRKDK
jgi:hypothetical protein